MRVRNKIALVTGAAGDIGRTTALRLSAEGATLVISDIDEAGGRKTLQELRDAGGTAYFFPADLTREDHIVGLFRHAVDACGRLDILANIAGGDYEAMVGFDDISVDGMERNLAVNLKSCILCCREASKIMMPQNYGRIVNMCSILYRGGPTPMQHTYAAAKGGVFSVTRGLAMNLGMYAITVNAVAPSLIEARALKLGMGDMWEPVSQDAAARYPLGRIGQPIDVANCILFLASDEASFITGQVIEVSGGARL
jgi:3-oxoacyl-[acyl-carrier protein] reductase